MSTSDKLTGAEFLDVMRALYPAVTEDSRPHNLLIFLAGYSPGDFLAALRSQCPELLPERLQPAAQLDEREEGR